MAELSNIILYVLASICFILGILHLFWAFNGQWGRHEVIPTTLDGTRLFEIGPISCLIVAVILLWLCLFYFLYFNLDHNETVGFNRSAFYDYGILIIGLGFIGRWIGDFKYVGFFKSIRNTSFGRLDTKYFSPLCGMLGLGNLALYILSL